MNELLNMMNIGIAMSTPLVICVLGGIFPHKAGVLNIAMDGMMNIGAFASIYFSFITGNVLFGIVMGVVCAMVLGLIFSIFSITLEGNRIITGLAVNLLSISIVPFLLQTMYSNRTSLIATEVIHTTDFRLDVPVLRSIPIINEVLNNQTILTYCSFLLIFIIWMLMYKTKIGVYVRLVGENEEAAKAVGIKVKGIRYFAILISSALAGLAGANLSVESLGMYTLGMVAGRGYIALSAARCGKGNPIKASLFTLIFGLARALQIKLTTVVDSATASLIEMLPYVFILIAMFATALIDNRNNQIRGYMND
ncbi:ABC transporter permease [Clostridium sp. AM58-1XD]|uniref:ABC transporter permease n=1 Tax=Clostridium sp. AM58-1XD TaxID=2292307 RepID=UPI000E4E1682|nr:ABC transporter permease [Clostridium sp. AM58-1XD]RGY98733.1 ABC transporter permease [Clostridium sp. AM58-1XD]